MNIVPIRGASFDDAATLVSGSMSAFTGAIWSVATGSLTGDEEGCCGVIGERFIGLVFGVGFGAGLIAVRPLPCQRGRQNGGDGDGCDPTPSDGTPDLKSERQQARVQPVRAAAGCELKPRAFDVAAADRQTSHDSDDCDHEEEAPQRQAGNHRVVALSDYNEACNREKNNCRGGRNCGDDGPHNDSDAKACSGFSG